MKFSKIRLVAQMSKFWLLVKQLYKQKVKAKSFIFSIVLYIAVISGVMFWSDIKEAFFQDERFANRFLMKQMQRLRSFF